MGRTIDIPDPDITWDLNRLTPVPNTSRPTTSPTSRPTTPSPATPAPTTPEPTPEPTQEPTPEPTPDPTSEPTDSTVTSIDVAPEGRTYYSCPPPASKTVSARDENGSDVLFEIPPPVHTARIAYGFQIQLLEASEDIDDMLPDIEERMEDSLGSYYKSQTEDGDDEGSCAGYYVGDFRRRRRVSLDRLGRRSVAEEDVPTRIIGISTVEDLAVDEDRQCHPPNRDCYVVRGKLAATYVGFNEPGVRSSVSRAVKEEMVENVSDSDDVGYSIQYLGAQDEAGYGGTRTAESPSTISSIISTMSDAVPKSQDPLTPFGIAILAAFGTTFLVLCYALFVKSDATDKVKDEMDKRREKKAAKKKALGDGDGERQTDDQDYCYDLESVAMGSNASNEDEGGFEVKSSRNLGGSVFSGAEVSRDSGRTKKMSNKVNDVSYAKAQRMTSLLEDDDEDASACASSRVLGPKMVSQRDAGCSARFSPAIADHVYPSDSNAGAPVVDRLPSSARGSPATLDLSPTNGSTIHQLPSISEADGLPPPMNDTPKIQKARRGGYDEPNEDGQWEV